MATLKTRVFAVFVRYRRTTSPQLRVKRQIRLAADEQDVTETAHRDVRRLRAAERRDLAVLDQDVVERERDLAVDWRPVVRVGRDDEDVPVQT